MRTTAFIFAVAALAACGQSSNKDPGLYGAKGDQADDGRVIWSDGEHSVGAYQWGYSDRLAASYVDGLVATGELPAPAATRAPDYYYSIYAHSWQPGGSLPFYVRPETQTVKLDVASFVIKVEAEARAGRPTSEYDLALLKFNRVGGVEAYTSVVMRLDAAIAGRVVTTRDEATHAPGMLAMLQSELDGPDRLGFFGTWKAIVVPRNRAVSAEVRRFGTQEVTLTSVRLIATPAPLPPPAAPLPGGLLAAHQQVISALAARNYDALAQFVHPDCGIFELYNPGVTTGVVNQPRISDDLAAMRFGVFDSASCPEPLNSSELPSYSCEAEAYTKTGCFASTVSGYRSLSVNQAFIDEWVTLEPSTPEYLAKQRRCESAVSVAISSTDDGYTLSYGQIDGSWYVIVIDHVTPCDA